MKIDKTLSRFTLYGVHALKRRKNFLYKSFIPTKQREVKNVGDNSKDKNPMDARKVCLRVYAMFKYKMIISVKK